VPIPIAKAGVRVHGLDKSPAMLDSCRRRISEPSAGEQDLITLTQADIHDLAQHARFSFIHGAFLYPSPT